MPTEIAPVERKDHWQLTPWPARSCWRKKHRGQVYYVGKGTERYSEADYKRAWNEWEAKEQELRDQERKANTPQAVYDTLRAVWSENGLTPEQVRERLQGTTVEGQATEQLLTARAEQLDRQRKIKAAVNRIDNPDAGERTVGNMIDRFLARKKSQAQTGQKSVGRFANLESYLKRFKEFVGADEPAKSIDAITLSDYHEELLELIEAEKIGDYTARDRFAAVKQFVRWTWEMGACELPRNIESRELSIGVTAGDVQPMPLDALRARVAKATGRLKLELLLMANAGFTQIDCGDLLHTEINWQAGTITRKRSKKQKGREKSLPTVTYYLWPSTLKLLRELATEDSPHVLATRQGQQTTRDGFSKDGKPVRSDATGQAYRKFEQANFSDHWTPKRIRKTSATEIGNSKEYARYAQYFLGQSPESVADTHYVRPSEQQFKECLQWLGKHLQLDE